ncbi:MAG: helix-turn-helix domain-containing protein [Clostridia bacterium]|nr:helix-turn-helix domain-containing protein [Clostridia bacterium]
MRLDDIKPFVRQAIMSRMSLGKYVSYRLRTRDHRLFYIMGGTGQIVVEGVPYPIRPGMVVLLRSGTEYIWQVGDMRYLAINFDYHRAHENITRSFHVERAELVSYVLEPDICFSDAEALSRPVVLYDAASLEGRIMSIVSEFSLRRPYAVEYLGALLKAVIIAIARRCQDQQGVEPGSRAGVREIIAYVGRNYTKPIKNTDIAAALHFNPSYMNRLFKAHTGMTVRAFLIEYRINAAIDLISGGELSTTELASAVGFTDVPHFIKTFKAHTGKTPKEYAKG